MTSEHADRLALLHDNHAPALERFALRLCGDPVTAQDITQEALLRAWRSPAILDADDEEARRWLFTVVRHLAIDEHRRARYRHELMTADPPDTAVDDATDVLLQRWLVTDALSSLSLEHRRAVVSCYYLRRTVVEIAASEGVPAGTIKSRLHYGLKALKLALQERGAVR